MYLYIRNQDEDGVFEWEDCDDHDPTIGAAPEGEVCPQNPVECDDDLDCDQVLAQHMSRAHNVLMSDVYPLSLFLHLFSFFLTLGPRAREREAAE